MAAIVERYVISLSGSPRRKSFFEQEFSSDFKVWEAFDGRDGAGEQYFDRMGFEKLHGRAPEGGEIGCTISHVNLLAYFAQKEGRDDDLMLVAEDDAVFSGDAQAVITRVAEGKDIDWALLGDPYEDPRRDPFWSVGRDRWSLTLLARPVGPKARPWRYRLGEAEGKRMGAGLYLVSREAARRLTDYARRFGLHFVADDYGVWHDGASVTPLLLRPTVAGWLGDSEINPDCRPHLEVAQSRSGSRWGVRGCVRRAKRLFRSAQATWRVARRRLPV